MEIVKLSDICYPKQWKTIPTGNLLKEGYPVYGANGIIGYWKEYNHEQSVVAITCRGATCGNVNLTLPKAYVTGNAMCLENVKSDIDLEYLYFCLLQYDFKKVISGSAQPQITRQGLEKVNIKLVDCLKQKQIVTKLKKIISIIEFRKQQLQKLDELIQARFVEMFEKKNCESVRLGDVCTKITDGTHKTPDYLDKGITFISAKNIVNGELDFSDVKHISEEQYMEIQKRCQTELNDILLSKSGSLGVPVIIKTDKRLGLFESLAVIKYDRTKLIPEFLCEQLKTERIQRQFRTGIKGVAVKHLHLGVISDIRVIVPPIEEQNQFADFVNQVHKSKVEIQQALEKTQLLFDSLMQQYFG